MYRYPICIKSLYKHIFRDKKYKLSQCIFLNNGRCMSVSYIFSLVQRVKALKLYFLLYVNVQNTLEDRQEYNNLKHFIICTATILV